MITEKRRLQKRIVQKKYKNSPKGKITQAKYFASKAKLEANRRYREKYQDKIKAGRKLNWAIKTGVIKRGSCRDCGIPNAQAHHPDYTKPLEVIWLCPLHHKREHIRLQLS